MDVDHAEASTAIPPQDRFDLHHHSHKAYEGDNLALAHSLPQSSSSSSSSSSLASYIAGIVRGTAAKWGNSNQKRKCWRKPRRQLPLFLERDIEFEGIVHNRHPNSKMSFKS